MKKILSQPGSLLVLLISSVVLAACECSNVDCAPSDPDFYFHYVTGDTLDLLGNGTKEFDEGDLRFAAVDSLTGDSVYTDVFVFPLDDSLSLAAITIRYHATRWVLQVKDVNTDTIDFQYRRTNTDCCGTYTNLSRVTLNRRSLGLPKATIIVRRD